ncbi:MAG: hypothetical protein OXQ93_10860 [Gemmatimonadota bacterium]|nr:hypothetical protein [Gemmatimonadota bacterium]
MNLDPRRQGRHRIGSVHVGCLRGTTGTASYVITAAKAVHLANRRAS